MKVCMGGGEGAGRGGAWVGAGATVGFPLSPLEPLLLLTVRTLQLVNAFLFVPQDPPSLCDDLHRWWCLDQAIGLFTLPGNPTYLLALG
jgi:hypothetical protein